MKIEEREDGISLIPESEFEIKVLKRLNRECIARVHFEDSWEQKGKLLMDFNNDWGR